MGLNVLRMVDGLVTLVDKVNLKGLHFWQRKFLVWGQRAQEDVLVTYCIKQATPSDVYT